MPPAAAVSVVLAPCRLVLVALAQEPASGRSLALTVAVTKAERRLPATDQASGWWWWRRDVWGGVLAVGRLLAHELD